MKALKLTLTLETPIVVTQGSGEGQRHTCLDYVPGGAVLGAFVNLLDPAGAGADFEAWFLSDRVRYLNAYPLHGGRRCLPLPLSYAAAKDAENRVKDRLDYDRGIAGNAAFLHDLTGGGQAAIKATQCPFIDPDCQLRVVNRKGIQTHIGYDREMRRAKESIIFNYEYLEGSQQFLGYILFDEDAPCDAFLRAAGNCVTLRVGRSRTGGYGHVAAHLEAVNSFQECDTNAGPARTLTLLSDYCPRQGVRLSESFEADVREALGNGAQIDFAYTDTRLVTGFRAVWGLPRAQVTTFSKGSVFTIAGGNSAAWTAPMWDGLGMRRNEGFGRVAVNWKLHQDRAAQPIMLIAGKKVKETDRVSGAGRRSIAALGTHHANFDRQRDVLWKRRARRVSDALCAEALQHPRMKAFVDVLIKGNNPPNSQLTNLRSALASPEPLPKIEEWFDKVLSKTSGDKWSKVRVPTLRGANEGRTKQKFLHELMKEEFLGDSGLATIKTLCEMSGGPPLEARYQQDRIQGNRETIVQETHSVLVRQFLQLLLKHIVSARNIAKERLG
ncbi:MAG: hypothetical protein HYV27_08060 [Candidatus Hydrogenedentes bacterium]|nr:hypothetical protein [Candidatus Hydrogenedentota bacterium]